MAKNVDPKLNNGEDVSGGAGAPLEDMQNPSLEGNTDAASATGTSGAGTSEAGTSEAGASEAGASEAGASEADMSEGGDDVKREPTREEIIQQWKDADASVSMGHSIGILGQGMASIFVVLGIIAVIVGMLKKLDNKKKK